VRIVPTLAYHVVDVFTDRPYAGNPLAVVLDADDLSTEALQALAREFHLSETAFPMRSSVADYRLRIFTPVEELPFAGHPSVGAAWLLARLGKIRAGQVRQECGARVLPVQVTSSGATLTGGAPSTGPTLDPAALLPLFGLDATALVDAGLAPDGNANGPGPSDAANGAGPTPVAAGRGTSTSQPRVAGAGLPFGYLRVHPAAVAAANPDLAAIERLTRPIGVVGLSVFSWDPAHRQAHARVFVPGVGEDPATGAAAVGLGVYLAAADLVPDDQTTDYTIRQGGEIRRPSLLTCTVTRAGGTVTRTTVGGAVSHVAIGEVVRP
jgi:trans-2,3-dihydro-3-hydroxyanthranilate isomerase